MTLGWNCNPRLGQQLVPPRLLPLPLPVTASRFLSPVAMAGSRLETVGSVFSRTRDLMRAGVLKEKPLWFDIYKAFPPLREPVFQRPRLRYGKAKAAIQDIFYHEDQIRAKFFSIYGSGHKAFDLFNPNFKSTCQRFVEKYMELQNLGETDEEKLFVETGKALLAEGIILRRVREARTVSVRRPAPSEGNEPQEEDGQQLPVQGKQEPEAAPSAP